MSGPPQLPPEMQALYTECELSLRQRLALLPDKPEESPESTLRVLWHLAAGFPRSVAAASEHAIGPLPEGGPESLRDLIRQRLAGTPLAHLSGRQRFMGLEMLASPDALVPRAETELLGFAALDALKTIAPDRSTLTVIDVCTGSGNLALAIASMEPRARVWAADLSIEAVELGRRNAEHVKLANRVTFMAGDLLAPFDSADFHGRVDMIICNPPYISSGKVDTMADEIIAHEPRLAFDGGPLGVSVVTRLIREAPRYLRPGGWLCFEVGLGQSRGVRQRLAQQGTFDDIREIADAHSNPRVLVARAAVAKVDAVSDAARESEVGYEIRSAHALDDEAVILDRWQDGLFQPASAMQKLDWFYRRSPTGSPDLFLLTVAGAAVGIGSLAKRQMYLDGKTMMACVPIDFVITEAHRSLFPAIHMQKHIRRAALIASAIAFTSPNDKSLGVFARAGYKRIGELVRHTRVLRAAPYLSHHLPAFIGGIIGPVADLFRNAGVALQLLTAPRMDPAWQERPDASFDALFQRCLDRSTLLGERDARFLAWRFADCPFYNYRFFTLRAPSDQRLLGYAACRVQADHLYVDDFLIDADAAEMHANFWRALARAAYRQGHAALTLQFLGSPAHRGAIAAAGLVTRDTCPVLACASSQFPGGLAAINWYLTAADFDT